ncbi:hypothetical protein [Streptomyces sp. NBC_01565]|uniref:hypothetical protein n=1 Tax=Streptomyces sp. NBC_01565 TaxID=2975881 RepID=UPI0022518013|nr:hypothetical protein [Streptomyces sp. NBC_01565]MCX4543754.1 hypothetical protein [Streptomyces sp. NBC_01565]
MRRQFLSHLNSPASQLRSKTSEGLQTGLDALATNLRDAHMYWVAPEMAALAMSAGAQLAAARWATADRPSPCGLLWWADGIGNLDSSGVQIPVEGIAWGPYEGDLMMWLLMSRSRLANEMQSRNGMSLIADQMPPMIPVYGETVPVTDEPVSLAGLEGQLPVPIVAALAAAWLLMQQPALVEHGREWPPAAEARSSARAGLRDPAVTVATLRRQYLPDIQDIDEGRDAGGRRCRHRWVVSGHWRDQPYGPDRALRRKTWIPAYVKGPDGAPLLSTERVNVWRR